MGLRPLAFWDCGFESRWGHGCLSVASVVCCLVEVSATSWSLAQRSPTDCGVCECDRGTSIMKGPTRDYCAMEKLYIIFILIWYCGDPRFKYRPENWVFWVISVFSHPSMQTVRCYFSLCHDTSFLYHYSLIRVFCNTEDVNSELIILPLNHSIVFIEVYILIFSFSSFLISVWFLDRNHFVFLSILLFIYS